MTRGLRRILIFATAVLAVAAVIAGPAVTSASAVNLPWDPPPPGSYDNTKNTTVNNQTWGAYRDVIWWGKASAYACDYINANPNLISNGGSPARAVVGGDDYAINFTGQRSGGSPAGQSWITVYDTTPADGTATKNAVDFTASGGVTIRADVLFASAGHTTAGGILAMFDDGSGDGLAMVAHRGGGNNPDFAKLSVVDQIGGIGTELTSVNVGQFGFSSDTNPGLLPAQMVGSTSGDNWYRLVMNVSVTGGVVTVNGSFYRHLDPWDPTSPTETLALKITDLSWSGTLGAGLLAGKNIVTPGEVGLIAQTPEPFSDGVANNWTCADPHTDNVGISIIPRRGPGEPGLDVRKYISIDGGQTWLSPDDPMYPLFVPFGINPLFKFVVTNTGGLPLYGVSLTDDFFSVQPSPPWPAWSPAVPNPLNPIPDPNSTYEYVYGPVPFGLLFPCAANNFLVWGKGTQTAAGGGANKKVAVHAGQGSEVFGNVGSEGDVNLNGTAWILGDLVTASQFFGQMPPHVAGAFLINQFPVWPDPPYPKPAFPAPVVIPAPNTFPANVPNGGSLALEPWEVMGKSYGDVKGGGGVSLYFTSGTYYLNSLSLANGGKLYFDLTSGPIKIYVKGQASFGSATRSYLTGGNASGITLESQWVGTASKPYGFSHAGGYWAGTVVCRTSGIKFGTGSNSGVFEGFMWSDWNAVVGSSAELAIDIQHGADVILPPRRCDHHNKARAVWSDGQVTIEKTDDIYAYWESQAP